MCGLRVCVFHFWCSVSGAGFSLGFSQSFSLLGFFPLFFFPWWMLGSILLNLWCVCVPPAPCWIFVGLMLCVLRVCMFLYIVRCTESDFVWRTRA